MHGAALARAHMTSLRVQRDRGGRKTPASGASRGAGWMSGAASVMRTGTGAAKSVLSVSTAGAVRQNCIKAQSMAPLAGAPPSSAGWRSSGQQSCASAWARIGQAAAALADMNPPAATANARSSVNKTRRMEGSYFAQVMFPSTPLPHTASAGPRRLRREWRPLISVKAREPRLTCEDSARRRRDRLLAP